MFVVHHVGGRAGSRGFPLVSGIEHNLVNVLYDADPDCIEQVVNYNSRLSSETMVLPYCLGANSGRRFLQLTYDPYASSLLSPNTATGLFYTWQAVPEFDYALDKTLSVVRQLEVEVHRLDEICMREKVPPPDFLSIDVQGTELDVLKGCGSLLDNVVGVQIEVEFEEMYNEQPLFSEVDDFMRQAGFILMHIDGFPFDPGPLPPVGARARGSWAAGEALYLKRPGGSSDDRLALAALAFGYAAWAHACKPPIQTDCDWKIAVQEFHEICANDHSVPPAEFTDVYSIEESFARFDSTQAAPQIGFLSLKSFLRKVLPPRIKRVLRRLLSGPRRSARRRRLFKMQASYRSWAARWGFDLMTDALDDRIDSVA